MFDFDGANIGLVFKKKSAEAQQINFASLRGTMAADAKKSCIFGALNALFCNETGNHSVDHIGGGWSYCVAHRSLVLP
jgi:hypothetical protein